MQDEELKRLEEAHRFLQLDFDKKHEFKDITDLAAQLCDKPVSLITILDKEVNWIKIATGVDMKASPRATSFCQYGIQEDELLIIPDATKDSRFVNNPLVQGTPGVRFYAGAPLVLSTGYKIGTLCLFDFKPGSLTPTQQKALVMLSRQATFLMELELAQEQLLSHIREIESKNQSLRAIAQMQSHDIRQPLASIVGLVNLVKDGQHVVDDDWLKMVSDATGILDDKIHAIVNETLGNTDLKLLRFNKMVEEIDDYAILLLDKNGNVENWNKGARRIKGYQDGDIIGKNFEIFYTTGDREKGQPRKLLDYARQNGVARDDGWRMRKDGTTFWARVVITAIHDEEGEVIGFTKVTRDLTNVKTTVGNRYEA